VKLKGRQEIAWGNLIFEDLKFEDLAFEELEFGIEARGE
jgi:hypothetical protein